MRVDQCGSALAMISETQVAYFREAMLLDYQSFRVVFDALKVQHSTLKVKWIFDIVGICCYI